jgi:small nuclear ribonucleoprotein (snRNP)-like protein
MFSQLSSSIGAPIIVELGSGKQLAGNVVEADQNYLRLQTSEGI